jgi:nicotinate-nucleotide adenylyltransferase
VLFAPVGTQPLKQGGASAGFDDRVAMTRLAIADEPWFVLSLADAPKASNEPNFTIDTLVSIRAELRPNDALFFLMGADSFFGLRQWHRAAEIPFAASLIVASRPGQQLDGLKSAMPDGLTIEPAIQLESAESGAEASVQRCLLRNLSGNTTPFYVMPSLQIEISASQVRQLIRDRASQAVGPIAKERQLLPQAVLDYILARGLYR